MKTCSLFSVVPVLLLFSPAAAGSEWDSLQSLHRGERVQVIQTDLKSFSGDLLGVSEKAIRIRVRNEELRIRRPDVFRVSVDQPSRRRRNALVCAALGAGVAAVTGAAALDGAIVAGVVLIGGGAGAYTGSAFPGYVTVYRAPQPAPSSRDRNQR